MVGFVQSVLIGMERCEESMVMLIGLVLLVVGFASTSSVFCMLNLNKGVIAASEFGPLALDLSPGCCVHDLATDDFFSALPFGSHEQ